MTPAGIEPETFRFVEEHLNHWTTAVPPLLLYQVKFRSDSHNVLGLIRIKPNAHPDIPSS